MLAAIFIGRSPGCFEELRGLPAVQEKICIYRTIFGPQARHELVRVLNKLTPDVVFLDMEATEEALQEARDVRAVRPEAVVIGVARHCKAEADPRFAEASVDAVLLPPFTAEKVQKALSQALTVSQRRLAARLLVFLPAKAGSGCSTTALNVAAALARVGKQRVLLIDADLHSGLLATLTGQTPEHSIIDALEAAGRMEEKLWRKLVVSVHGLDLLASPRAPELGAWVFSAWDYLHLLGFVMSRYDAVVVDLPEVVNDATEAIVRQARCIYVLSTPEMPSLILARRRIAELQNRGWPPEGGA
jgi:pilus assembly protein CpaE